MPVPSGTDPWRTYRAADRGIPSGHGLVSRVWVMTAARFGGTLGRTPVPSGEHCAGRPVLARPRVQGSWRAFPGSDRCVRGRVCVRAIARRCGSRRRWGCGAVWSGGRLERSYRPASPSARQRRTHLWAVAREMPISSATWATGLPARTRSIRSRLPCTVSRALGWGKATSAVGLERRSCRAGEALGVRAA